MTPAVSIEEVTSGKGLSRFIELPQVLAAGDPHFAPLVMAWERYRLDRHRNPFFDHGEAVCLLARRQGRLVGRIAAHMAAAGAPGRFGFWWVQDDPVVAAALLEAAGGWLAKRGCRSMSGPFSFTEDDEAGVLVAGHDRPGLTGRPWHPPHLAGLLEAHGFERLAERPSWRLSAEVSEVELPPDDRRPPQAGAHSDSRVCLAGIAAVPDVAEVLRQGALRAARDLARRARSPRWETCTVVRCDLDPATGVPALRSAAARAGYRWVVAPWCPEADSAPETVHRLYSRSLPTAPSGG